MARLAFTLAFDVGCDESKNRVRIDLYEIAEHYKKEEAVSVMYQKNKEGKWYLAGYDVISDGTLRYAYAHSRVLELLARILDADENANLDQNDALQLLTKIEERGGRQCVWQGESFTPVKRIKDDQGWFSATHLSQFKVQAKDEKIAKERLTRLITDAMVAKPSEAKDLASWFAAGQPVTTMEGSSVVFLDRCIFGTPPVAKKKEVKPAK